MTDHLESWNTGPAKSALLDLVERASHSIAPGERVAVFDNDGTLWAEKPVYVQLEFAIERIRELAADHTEWKHQSPFREILDGDLEAAAAGGQHAIVELVMASHAGMTSDEFEQIVVDWLAHARHPRFKRPYTELVYQPMLEVIDFLKAHAFDVFIASAGGVEFIRPWVERVYGLPRSHVIGSSIKTELDERHGDPVLVRRREVEFVDEGPGKPVGIHKFVGRRPIAAFGNADGDTEMLAWTTNTSNLNLGVLVHHTDDEREWAYDRETKIGKLDQGLDDARTHGWTVVDMKRDWRRIFSFD